MELVLKGLHWQSCLIYLDDVIVMSRTVDEGLTRLEQIFERLSIADLKLKPRKCSLFQKEVSFLGHVVTEEGIATDPSNVEQVVSWPVPESVTEVRSFLGLVSYYRRFIPGFSDIAKPLYRLTEVRTDFQWTPQCQLAFEELKKLLTCAPVLAYPNKHGEFILDTDASDHGIGAVLSQVQDGVEKPIAYASRTLTKSERNYCVTRRELLAIVEFVKHHRHYLHGTTFRIRTDHAALRSILKAKQPEGQLARWIEYLCTFQFEIQHREGLKHQNADSLSRRPCTDRCKWCVTWKSDHQKAKAHASTQTEDLRPQTVQADVKRGEQVSAVKLEPSWTTPYLQSQQQSDADLRFIIDLKKKDGKRPAWEEISPQGPAVKAMWSQWDRLYLRGGLLFRKWESDDGSQTISQLILPKSLRECALSNHHNHTTSCHLGVRKTLNSLRMRYYWPGLTSAVYKWVSRCTECGSKKSFGRKRRAPLKQYVVGAPMERLAMDILGPLPETPRKNKYVLVVTDYFTKWTESYPLPNQEASTVAEKLVGEFISRFGVPRQLHSDQGTNFESKVMAEVCKLLDIEKTRTTPLHPQSDGQVERFNRTLVEMLRGKIKDDQSDWDLQLPMCMMAYRSAVHESTGMSPNQLMLGREVEMPLDVTTELPPDSTPPKTDYVIALRERLETAHESARTHLKQAAIRQKRNYDKNLSGKPFKKGDSVWLHQKKRKKGRNAKLDCPWHGPFLIITAISDVVYRIQKNARSKPKVVHSDRLKPYLGPPLQSWLPNEIQAMKEIKAQEPAPGAKEKTMPTASTNGRPKRQRRSPDRYGNWSH